MADIARPALAEVLAATTERDSSWWRSWLASPYLRGGVAIDHGGVSFCARPDWRHEGTTHELRWLHASPAEAVEALETARLWPREPGDDPTRWWCERCGDGNVRHDTADPPTLPALVAVVSLGAQRLARYVELARVIARVAGHSVARVVWRVMDRRAIEAHHKRVSDSVKEWDFPSMVSREEFLRSIGNASWPGLFAYDVRGEAPWDAIREISVGGGATPQPTGVHLVGLDASRIVLAVEAIGGDRG